MIAHRIASRNTHIETQMGYSFHRPFIRGKKMRGKEKVKVIPDLKTTRPFKVTESHITSGVWASLDLHSRGKREEEHGTQLVVTNEAPR